MQLPSKFDLHRIRDETMVREIDFHREIGSTNTRAMELSEQDNLPLPLLVLAEQQTAGRGRGANRWWSQAGSLTFSLLLSLDGIPAEYLPRISLTVGLAVCQAIEQFAPLADMAIKWPNDVYMSEKKLAGILIEVPPRRPPQAVIGVGINANNSIESAAADVASRAISLVNALETEVDLTELLIACLGEVESRVEQLRTVPNQLVDQWRAYHLLQGRSLEIDTGGQRIRGMCLDIDDGGTLLVQTSSGIQRCLAGVVNFEW